MNRYFKMAADVFVIGALVAISLYTLYMMCLPDDLPKDQYYFSTEDVQPTLDQDK